MHIHENEILLVKFPICIECNGIKYCGCQRYVWVWTHFDLTNVNIYVKHSSINMFRWHEHIMNNW